MKIVLLSISLLVLTSCGQDCEYTTKSDGSMRLDAFTNDSVGQGFQTSEVILDKKGNMIRQYQTPIETYTETNDE